MKTKKIGTIINREMVSMIQIIDTKTMRWKNIAVVLDTPNAVQAKKLELQEKGYTNLWVRNSFDRKPLF